MRKFSLPAATIVAVGLMAGPAAAQQLEPLAIKFIGQSSIESHSSLTEKPYFEKLTAKSGGKVTVDLQPFNLLGLKGTEILRLMKAGTLEWGSNGITFLAGENPSFEACDLAGLTTDLAAARKACDAYKPVFDRIMQQDWDTKLLALYPNPPQVFWCRVPINGLADIKGKKVRVFNKNMSDFVEAVGGTSVSIAFADVVPAMQRGVADCAVTGTYNGNIAKWFEVTTHIYPLSLGWAIQYAAVNKSTWAKLSPAMQKFLTDAFKELEDEAWKTGAKITAQGLSCNLGTDPCDPPGSKAKMVLVKMGDADEQLRTKIMREAVIPNWAKRCGAACAKEWNETVGKVVGIQAPTNF